MNVLQPVIDASTSQKADFWTDLQPENKCYYYIFLNWIKIFPYWD